jgi:cobalt-zinc-cadmium efflux system protein
VAAKEKENQTRTRGYCGITSGSMAILADSLHDFTDSLSLGAGCYFEEKCRKGTTDTYSFGYGRFSLVSAVVNALALLLGSIFIVYESVNQILNPQMPDIYWMIGIDVLGITFNGMAVSKLKSGKSMNKQVMTIHLMEDALGWIAVLIASIVMLFVHIPVLDPILAIVINLTVLFFVMRKLLQVFKIMLQRVPENVNLAALRQKMLCIEGIKEANSRHIWSLTREKIVVTVNVTAAGISSVDQVRRLKDKIQDMLAAGFLRDVFKPLNTEYVSIDLSM